MASRRRPSTGPTESGRWTNPSLPTNHRLMPYTDLSRMVPVRARYEVAHPERRNQDRHLDLSRNGSDTRKGRTPVERAAVRHQKVVVTPWWGLDGEGADYKINGRRFQ